MAAHVLDLKRAHVAGRQLLAANDPTSSDEARAAAFRAKWSSSMHWVYNSMAECVATWRERGINGLPRFTEGAAALLADDIARNEAFLSSIRGGSA